MENTADKLFEYPTKEGSEAFPLLLQVLNAAVRRRTVSYFNSLTTHFLQSSLKEKKALRTVVPV